MRDWFCCCHSAMTGVASSASASPLSSSSSNYSFDSSFDSSGTYGFSFTDVKGMGLESAFANYSASLRIFKSLFWPLPLERLVFSPSRRGLPFR